MVHHHSPKCAGVEFCESSVVLHACMHNHMISVLHHWCRLWGRHNKPGGSSGGLSLLYQLQDPMSELYPFPSRHYCRIACDIQIAHASGAAEWYQRASRLQAFSSRQW